MKITVCDICKKGQRDYENSETVSIMIPTHTQPDVAGGPSELVGEKFDLCINHLLEILREFTESSMGKIQLDLNSIVVYRWLNRANRKPIFKRS